MASKRIENKIEKMNSDLLNIAFNEKLSRKERFLIYEACKCLENFLECESE